MKSKKIFAQMLSLSFTFFLFPIIVNAASDWLWPVPSCKQITADRGYSYVSHKGIDIPGAYGANIVATKAGTIKTVYGGCTNHNAAASSGSNCESNGCHPTVNGATGLFYTMNGKKVCNYGSGNGVVIAHPDGTYSHYSHMSSTIVTQGQFVNQGDTIGYIGDSGNADGAHLHFTLTSVMTY